MHRIGEVAAGMRPGGFEEGGEMGMARTTLARDAGKLSFGNADRLLADRPVDRHSFPLVRAASGEPMRLGPNARA